MRAGRRPRSGLSQINAAGSAVYHYFQNAVGFVYQKMLANTMASKSEIAVPDLVVVIVDDDAAVCSSLKFLLELDGFTVRTYGGAAEFLASADFVALDCLVVDQRMPGTTGMELIGILRDRDVQTPAILIVSHANAALTARAALAGVPIVEKPLFGNALVDTIRKASKKI
jgi:two-component system, LuxR family, response regulator FixJ